MPQKEFAPWIDANREHFIGGVYVERSVPNGMQVFAVRTGEFLVLGSNGRMKTGESKDFLNQDIESFDLAIDVVPEGYALIEHIISKTMFVRGSRFGMKHGSFKLDDITYSFYFGKDIEDAKRQKNLYYDISQKYSAS